MQYWRQLLTRNNRLRKGESIWLYHSCCYYKFKICIWKQTYLDPKDKKTKYQHINLWGQVDDLRWSWQQSILEELTIIQRSELINGTQLVWIQNRITWRLFKKVKKRNIFMNNLKGKLQYKNTSLYELYYVVLIFL